MRCQLVETTSAALAINEKRNGPTKAAVTKYFVQTFIVLNEMSHTYVPSYGLSPIGHSTVFRNKRAVDGVQGRAPTLRFWSTISWLWKHSEHLHLWISFF